MKAAGWLLGLVAFGGLIVLSVAGMTAAIGVLVTATAIVGMIVLGNLLGGRTTPDHPPYGRTTLPMEGDGNSECRSSGGGAGET
ncbi:MAG: hypothetical protein ABSH04_00990 [Acidimicrobiales bacterium]